MGRNSYTENRNKIHQNNGLYYFLYQASYGFQTFHEGAFSFKSAQADFYYHYGQISSFRTADTNYNQAQRNLVPNVLSTSYFLTFRLSHKAGI